MSISTLQTLDEVLHYGSLGEVVATTQEDWDNLIYLVEKYLDDNTPECDIDGDYDKGYDSGYGEGKADGYNACLDKYELEE